MLFSSRIFLMNSRSNLLSSIVIQQLRRRLTPISSQPYLARHHFHQKCSAVRRNEDAKTGLLDKVTSINTYQHNDHLRKFIHGQSALNCKQKSDEKNVKKDDTVDKTPDELIEEYNKLGLVARFKKMTKEYWYVLIPVHCFTSCFWFGGFYYASVW